MDFTACQFCGGAADLLCDHVLGFPRGARGEPDWKANPYTCDAPICSTCGYEAAKGVMCTRSKGCETFSTDLCPAHRYRDGRDPDIRLRALTPMEAGVRRLKAWNEPPPDGPPALPPNRPPPRPKRKAA